MYIQSSDKNPEGTLISLTCNDHFCVTLCSVGASIRSVQIPSSHGKQKNLALSFQSGSSYLNNSLYAGATLAPCAGRISNGQLAVGSQRFLLTRNENKKHCLHSGTHSASFLNWETVSVKELPDSAEVCFRCSLPDKCDGFPGNRIFTVIYTLSEAHELTVRYHAVSDQDTYFNMTNHSYFNLTGDFTRSACDHSLQISASRYIYNDNEFIPAGIACVNDIPFDFRKPVSLSSLMKKHPENQQLKTNRGYNHAFILDHTVSPQLCFKSPDQNLSLKISSDAPCVVVYSGGFIEYGLALADNQLSCPGCAVAFEFQDYPDAPGNHNFPFLITSAGQSWTRTIQYSFCE